MLRSDRSLRTLGLLTGSLLVSGLFSTAAQAVNTDTQALFKQGQRYERASHTNAEFRRAYWSYCLAGRHGHAEAAYNIAWMYLNGRGVPRDDELAGHWLDVSARLGDPHSMHLADRLVLDSADDDPNCPRALGRKQIDIQQFNAQLARFDNQGSPFDLLPVSNPPLPHTPEPAKKEVDQKPQQATIATPEPAPADKPAKPAPSQPRLALKPPAPAAKSTPNKANAQAPKSESSPESLSTALPPTGTTRTTSAAAVPSCPWTMAATNGKYRQRVIDWLTDQGIQFSIKNERDRLNSYYVVMVHPHDDRPAAKATASQLREKGHASLKIFNSGPYQYAVSLGIFRMEHLAANLTHKLQGDGFTAIYKPMKFPPVLPLIRAHLNGDELNQLRRNFPPLPVKQINCDQLA